MKYSNITVVLTLMLLVGSVSGDTEIINLKADATWKATSNVDSTEWFKPEYDDSTWDAAVPKWPENPCMKYCGKMTSCELTCVDWMWHGETCDSCERFFRKTINLPEEVISAKITITADNYYWLYVNNNFVGSDTTKSGYQRPETYDITSYLRPGKNVISIKAEDSEEFEGVALVGEIRYKTYSELINQLQSEIDSLENQVNTLTSDKTRLQDQADALTIQVNNLTTSKDYFSSESARLGVENAELKNENSRLSRVYNEMESSLNTHKILNIVLILGVLISLGVAGAVLYYFYVKIWGRKPSLSKPGQKPLEKKPIAEDTHLSESELNDLTPMFHRERQNSLAKKGL